MLGEYDYDYLPTAAVDSMADVRRKQEGLLEGDSNYPAFCNELSDGELPKLTTGKCVLTACASFGTDWTSNIESQGPSPSPPDAIAVKCGTCQKVTKHYNDDAVSFKLNAERAMWARVNMCERGLPL